MTTVVDRSLEVVPFDAPLGAEVRGVDLATDPAGDVVFDILGAFADHQLLVFRDQELSDERLLEIAEWWGPQYAPPEGIPMLGDEDQAAVVSISNTPGGVAGEGALPAHTDLQYMPVPLLGAMLYALEVPSSGGDTSWSNLYQAYDELDDETKAAIEGVRGVGINPYAGDATGREIAGGNQHYTDEVPDFPHPLVRTHPVTGRKILYFSYFVVSLEGIDDPDEEQELLDRLRAHVDQDHLYFTHRWRPGDLLVWDNRCTNHKRADFDSSERRVMHRVQIAGTRPF